MSANVNLINFLQQGIAEHLIQVDKDAQLGRELHHVLQDYIQQTWDLVIYQKADYSPYIVTSARKISAPVFESFSYTACVEWVLKQPIKEGKDE